MLHSFGFLCQVVILNLNTYSEFQTDHGLCNSFGFYYYASNKAIWKYKNSVCNSKPWKCQAVFIFLSRLKPLAMNLVRWGSTQMKCDLWCHVVREGSNIQCRHLTFLSSNMLLPWVSLNNHLHLDLLSGKNLLPIWDFSYIVKSTKEWFFSEILFSPFNKQNPL